ncbi:MAG: succinate dehydrogenase, partial [Planctomycetota bacterium]
PRVGGHPTEPVSTTRNDPWWIGPLLTFLGLSAFVVYATWRALQGANYYSEPYLSPFYSPVLFVKQGAPGAHAWFGTWPAWWPSWLPASPALLILPFPGAFRFTCYYYRKAYYRAFAGSPPGCAVTPFATGKRTYHGETRLLLFQNLHRYALYFALVFVAILYYDAFRAFFYYCDGRWEFGIGVGTIVLLINATLLAGYTFGCHSLRHLIGGRLDCLTCDGRPTPRFKLWKIGTWFNGRHMVWAWVSLFWVAFTDLYVWLVAMGKIHDFNTWN